MKALPRLFTALGLATLAAAAALPRAQAAVWTTHNQWSQAWEDGYSAWVKKHWDHHFFQHEGTPYFGLKLDCADVVYSMRIIYAYENALPFAMHDATGGKGQLSNAMSRWDKLPTEAERVREFLRLIYDVGSTHSLPADTYPVAISRQAIRAGGLLLTDAKNHHSWTIKDFSAAGIPHFIYSSRPAKSDIRYKIGFPTTGFVFPKGIKEESQAGFRWFREPGDLNRAVWDVPGYSKEQYALKLSDWRRVIQEKIAVETETYEAGYQRELADACQAATERVTSVREGLDFLGKNPRCFSATEFDDYSTPNRDERLKNSFEELDLVLATGRRPFPINFCPIEIAPGKILPLSEVRRRSLSGLLSWNPHDSLESRWGIRPGKSALARRCKVYQ